MKRKRVRSLRAYLAKLNDLGDVQEIDKEVDWNLEMSAIARRCYDTQAPAPLFNCVKDAPGFRALGAPCGLSSAKNLPHARICYSLGVDPDTDLNDIVKELADAADLEPIPPKIVAKESAECKEVILTGDEIDLNRLPVPMIHNKDGGRYINSWGIIVARSTDGQWTNWSIARIMLTGDGKRTMTGMVFPTQDIGILWKQWQELGQDMPFALVEGPEPGIPFVGAMNIPTGEDEAGYLGAWFNEAIEVVKCETNDLLVPASAEIVIEGTLSVTEMVDEGPFGEYAGYIWLGEKKKNPVYHVNAVTHRQNAILPFVTAGVPPEEDHTCWGIALSARCYKDLRDGGFPVKRVFFPFEAANHWCVITVDDIYKSRDESNTLMSLLEYIIRDSGVSVLCTKFFIVSDKIDPSNTRDALWAVATRGHTVEGIHIMDDMPILPLCGAITPEEKLSFKGTKAIYNCLGPFPVKGTHAEATQFEHWPEEIQKRVIESWCDYGFK